MRRKKETIYFNYQKVLSIFLTCILGWFFAFLATNVYKDYSVGLFVWLPIVLGATSTIIYGHKNEVSKQALRQNSYLTLFVFCLGLLNIAFEGLICIVMALPIGFFFTWIGFLIGFQIIKNKTGKKAPVAMIFLLFSVPVVMGFEYSINSNATIRSVTTRIEINAPIETVWRNVIMFPQLEEPTEFIFKTGIAYPINAQIDGHGVGATRHCNFSTGSFVEPITEWDEPRLLKFDVTSQPEPMKEISPYDIHPNHLHGYWVSKQGQFMLTQLSNDNTLLEGTTWYVNKIKPGIYWTIWSDYIVHSIHERVLHHIKQLSEKRITESN
jgi:hypothetical protein